MVDHRSTSLPECGPTEYPAPDTCFSENTYRSFIKFPFFWSLLEDGSSISLSGRIPMFEKKNSEDYKKNKVEIFFTIIFP